MVDCDFNHSNQSEKKNDSNININYDLLIYFMNPNRKNRNDFLAETEMTSLQILTYHES